MIQSLVSDDIWLKHFEDSPAWQPMECPTMVIAPHPDDETLGAGALIDSLAAQGVDVFVVAATDGKNCYDLPREERSELALLRQAEQRTALERLGVPPNRITRLGLTDSGLHLQLGELTDLLRSILQPGMHAIAPWEGDFHPDHVAAAAVAREKSLPLTSYFFWTWHRGEPSLLERVPTVRFVPSEKELHTKRDALQAHRSRLEYPLFEPILPERLLGPALWPFEVFLPSW